ncbi:HDOD domain-containing protein [Thiomicrorhabdus xiamenensis]|uniref:HDOD domain-containing protein n=1 Tax=Thiomicrorhabdus xiamenensis TaxID=2739063 RepID=A0A7D4SZJ5_9GAMM|nr:HDOD domain-containing protein [Thiomicrorhabdus xiamenensis]QKI89984.1 HDOD domain-containing protein [Thiomicrorhabdus xiamenensis]
MNPSLQDKIQVAKAILAQQSLPSVPQKVLLLKEEFDKPYPNSVTIANLISRNPEYLSSFLQIANACVAEEKGVIQDAKAAVNLIGLDDVFNLFVSTLFARLLSSSAEEEKILNECMKIGIVAAELSYWVYGVSRSEAYMLGLLQNTGYIFMRRHDPDGYDGMINRLRINPISQFLKEDKRYHTNHAVFSSLLGSKWNLPNKVVKSVLFHHDQDFERKLSASKEVCDLAALGVVSSYLVSGSDNAQYITQELKDYGYVGKQYLKLPDTAIASACAALKKWGNSATFVTASH